MRRADHAGKRFGRPIALIALAALTQPAWACHRYSRWSYPFPQSCKATALAPRLMRLPRARIDVAFNVPQPPHRVATPDIPLPSLTDIEWGHFPDDELRGRLLLRVVLGKEDE